MSCPSDLEIEHSLDGAHVEPGEVPIEAHLEECARCRSRAEAIEALDAALAAGLLARDPTLGRVSPRLLSRLTALGEREYAARWERHKERACGVPRRRTSARPRRAGSVSRAGPLPFALAASLTLAACGVVVFLFFAVGEEGAKSSAVARQDARTARREAAFARGEAPSGALSAATAPAPSGRGGGSAYARAPARGAPALAAAGDRATSPDSGTPDLAEPELAANVPKAQAGAECRARPCVPSPSEVAARLGSPRSAALPPALPGEEGLAPAEPTATRGLAEPRIPGENVALAPLGPVRRERAPLRLTVVRGELMLQRAGGETASAHAGARLDVRSDDALRVQGGGAAVVFGNGTELLLRAGTVVALAFEGSAYGVDLALEQGELEAAVVSGIAGNGLSVRTLLGEARIAGGRLFAGASRSAARFCALEGSLSVVSRAAGAGPAAGVAPGVPAGTIEAGAAEERALGPGELATLAAGRGAIDVESRSEGAGAFEPAWAIRLRPRHKILLSNKFEHGSGGFEGRVVSGGRTGERALEALRLAEDPEYAVRARVRRPALLRVRPATEIRFAYFLSEPSALAVEVTTEARDEAFRVPIHPTVAGEWAVASVLLEDFGPALEPAKRALRDNEVLTSVGFLAGRPDRPVRLLVDEVTVFERE